MATGQQNPYAPPAEDDEPRNDDEGAAFALASRGARFAGALIDGLAGLVLSFLVRAAMGDAANVFSPDLSKHRFTVPLAVGIVLPLTIQGALIATRGQSIGKVVMRTRIVDGDGRTAAFFQGFVLRTLPITAVALLPTVALGLGTDAGTVTTLTWVTSLFSLVDALLIFGDRNRCLHDRIAGTFVAVVGTQRPPADEPRKARRKKKRRQGG
jgi:uncharacterized RDD family membrane protein YckC